VPERQPLTLDADERDYIEVLLRELRGAGERGHAHPGLVDFVARVEALLRQAEHGELSQRVFLERVYDLEEAMTDAVDEDIQVLLDDLREALRRARFGARASPFAPE
jgi:hypothetical protein